MWLNHLQTLMRICSTQPLKQVMGKQEGAGFQGWDQEKETATMQDTGIEWEQEIGKKGNPGKAQLEPFGWKA